MTRPAPVMTRIQTVSGQYIYVTDKTHAEVMILKQAQKIHFNILESMSYDVILGMP